jgi:hypothetical protein
MYSWRLFSRAGFCAMELGYMSQAEAIEAAKPVLACTRFGADYYTHVEIARAGVVIGTLNKDGSYVST